MVGWLVNLAPKKEKEKEKERNERKKINRCVMSLLPP
jgi:hypothetical protein